VKGIADQIDYGMRLYDPRAGRFLSVDPLAAKYSYYTPYQFAGNTPVQATDLDGKEEYHYSLSYTDQGEPKLKLTGTKYYDSYLWGLIKDKIGAKRYVISYEGKNYPFTLSGIGNQGQTNDQLFDYLNNHENYENQFNWYFYSDTYITFQNANEGAAFGAGAGSFMNAASGKGKMGVKANVEVSKANAPENANTQSAAASSGNPAAGTANTANQNAVQVYEVGEFGDLQQRSTKGDKLDLHHIPQKQSAKQVIPGYDPKTGTAIAIPETVHDKISTNKGTYNKSPRQLLAEDAKKAKAAGVPSGAVKKAVEHAKQQHPQSYQKK